MSGFWIFGFHAVSAALANPQRRGHRLLAASSEADALDSVLDDSPGAPAPELVDRSEIARLLPPGAVHQGVALLAEPLEEPGIEAVLDIRDERAAVVVLDQVTDPRNVGAARRAAAAFGAKGVIMQKRHAPPETGTLAKAASGALEIVPTIRITNLSRGIADLQAAGYWCVGLDGQAQTPLAEADLSGRVALVLGSEGDGLRRLTTERCDQTARIPISPRVESLNLSTATAVALYEWARRSTGP
ncbi:MAG: 23S rRNA (guanosine(2251)-2'-O)-methyltransferase RlmB [Rhodospirillales bacterium]|nr:23S rRNA (guanosine(2251)-2'-O)-methyltransferase RlmB [Rhodospirillales bacterium]